MDDGDVRPAGALFDLKMRATEKAPRLAWSPWLRGFVEGAIVAAVIMLIINQMMWRWAQRELETLRAKKAAPIVYEWKEEKDARNGLHPR